MVIRRQITEAEKAVVLDRQGMRCFIDNHPIDKPSDVEFDHINPFVEGGRNRGSSKLGRSAEKHNRKKGTLSLSGVSGPVIGHPAGSSMARTSVGSMTSFAERLESAHRV